MANAEYSDISSKDTYLPIIYSRKISLASACIRLAAWWGPWSHCGIVDGDIVIESLALSGGVVISPLEEVKRRNSNHTIVKVWCPDPAKAIAWAKSTVGKSYDWNGVFAIPFKERSWQSEDKWYCSEHVEKALEIGGNPRFRSSIPGISPCQSYYVR